MKISIQNIALGEIDVTEYLSEDEKLTVDIGNEVARYKRAYDDATILFSNLDGFFLNLFNQTLPTERVRISIFSDAGTRIYKGIVQQNKVKFTPDNLYVRIPSFTVNKLFWEHAAIQPIWKQNVEDESFLTKENDTYWTVETILNKNLNPENFENLFSEIEVDSVIKSLPIRSYYITDDTKVGNIGMYRYLKNSTTIEQLLQAFALRYNLRYFIDYKTDILKVQVRGRESENITAEDIDEILCEDDSPTITWQDEEKLDYLYIAAKLQKPPAPSLATVAGSTTTQGIPAIYLHNFCVTNIYEQNGFIVESPGGELFPLTLNIVISHNGNYGNFFVTLNIPLGDSKVSKRRIYMSDGDGLSMQWYLIGEINDNTTLQFLTDGAKIKKVSSDDLFNENFGMWVRYDEVSKTWQQPISDSDTLLVKPSGNIISIIPELEFYDSPSIFYDVRNIEGEGNRRTNLYIKNPPFSVGDTVEYHYISGNVIRGTVKSVGQYFIQVDYGANYIANSGTIRRVPANENYILPQSITQIAAFFGGEINVNEIQYSFVKEFLTRRKFNVKVATDDVYLFKKYLSGKKIFPNDYTQENEMQVVQAKFDMMNYETQVSLKTL